ncbi:glycosyl hydrolase family 43 [Pontibacter ummariensis]|uniref:Glycosyl hydrolases family 43 n=1 Tax=Pontibacter ummariensis TaxID=1610492 RepID=A0A239DP89_9BACT|nr:glycoside hydrolase family 43 protein [Pontibacter ummariensis]PRY13852.1 glycosyl hydrolase family 43 [Pontibacter ummariensis]SNS33572.1 Glycosyl hydrolases family 43 [Pontibacter ummariensis]
MTTKAPFKHSALALLAASVLAGGCQSTTTETQAVEEPVAEQVSPISDPLVTEIFTADPSAHVFNGKIYVYPSHDIDAGVPEKDDGSHFAMTDYRVLSMDSVGGKVTLHDVALDIKDVPWAGRQMWAPDAAYKDGTYYLFFPAKDKQDIFRIGVATSSSPVGPFKAQPEPIAGSFSIDPAVFKDDNGDYYMYFGGIWGGQLQRWASGQYNPEDVYPADDQPALMPKVAKLSDDLMSFEGEVKDVQILDKDGTPLLTGENDKRFFEAAWVHKYNDKYYLSYSTGDTHNIAYAIGDSPTGPFTYQGVILKPVLGWTNHHSIVEHNGKWYLFFHDSSLSGGKTHLRSVKVTELKHRPDGTIETIDAMVEQPGA